MGEPKTGLEGDNVLVGEKLDGTFAKFVVVVQDQAPRWLHYNTSGSHCSHWSDGFVTHIFYAKCSRDPSAQGNDSVPCCECCWRVVGV